MDAVTQKIEAILFVAAKPMSVKKLADACGAKQDDVREALDRLVAEYDDRVGGVRILNTGKEVQMCTSPDVAETVREYLKDETTGEMTKPSLEALTIIAYRGPIAKGELEQIRGVNCSLILRNLMMRGLVEADGEASLPGTRFTVTADFLKYLGVTDVSQLPEYGKLSSHETIARILEKAEKEAEAESAHKGSGEEEKEGITAES